MVVLSGYLVARMLGLQRWLLANIQHMARAAAWARRLQLIVSDVKAVAYFDLDAARLIIDGE
jgi:hypothetical protein